MHQHIVCYSGGHSSALVAIEVVRKYGTESVVLLNHDINPSVEDADIKRFKNEVAAHLGLPVTYANYKKWDTQDQFDIVVQEKGFKAYDKQAICTSRLKTRPFMKWLAGNADPGVAIVYYGFDANEKARIQRRSSILAVSGWHSDYPLALWGRTIQSTREVGIEPPLTYATFKHANCIGCLKAGRQHWYSVFCTRQDIWEKAKWAEDCIGYTIIKDAALAELEPKFALMKKHGVVPTEHVQAQTFWAEARKRMADPNLADAGADERPCECVF